jgi:hypothetical protein
VIERVSIPVATCDACGHKDLADDDGSFLGGDGYSMTIVEHKTGVSYEVYACRETQIGKAARAVLAKFHSKGNGPPSYEDVRGTLIPADAPPLPSNDNDQDGAQ